ncbi:MFS transporter [Caldimonas brevitalea]|uniref:Beta-lactamase induction signal transducer n=1 Tax=Caldimonas brevitalea TaxID=413882 RepID=A0A0G3BHE3_9BURK|nr:MFS transporter [Caldimonas brevitalea]AKJ26766.1 beta-lactamase induction signal transducer [Caldimonas brevitalea]
MTAPDTATPPVPVYRRKLFWVALLYFSEGLPLGIFYDIFPVYFRQRGVDLADIGLLSLLGLAWTVKFLWAPAVDWTRHHRWWISAANLGMALVMWGFAGSFGFGPLVWVAIGLFTVLSATNDIATDGYTIELLDKREYGLANGLRIGFYRVGMLAAGVVLMVSGWFGWAEAYLVGGAVFALNGLLVLAAPREAPRERPAGAGVGKEFALLKDQPQWVLALALVLVGLLWPALPPLAGALDWHGLEQVGKAWWFRGAIPVALMFAGAGLMVHAAQGPRADAMREGPVFGAWVELLSRPGMLAMLLFILLFKLGDAAMGFMVKPFWVDAGFSNQQIGLVSVMFGLVLSIAGGLLGGWYVDRVGIFRGLWVLGLWQAASNLGYALAAWKVNEMTAQGVGPSASMAADYSLWWQATTAGGWREWGDQARALAGLLGASLTSLNPVDGSVYAASALESFTGGLGTGAFLAFLMSLTHRAKATTEYAILSSIFAFSRAVAGWAGGIGAQEIGFAAYFFLTFWLSFPAYLLLPQVRRMLEQQDIKEV